MKKIKDKFTNTCKWLRKNVLNKQMIIYVLIAELIFWSPCIVTGILAVTISPWYWTVFGGICAFWSGPFTPAVPLQIALAVFIKKIVERKGKMKVAYIKNDIIANTRQEVKNSFENILEIYNQKGLEVTYKKIRIVSYKDKFRGKYEIGIKIDLVKDKDKVRVIHGGQDNE